MALLNTMPPDDNAPLKITENLLTLERGKDEFILTDYVNLRPLYIKKGKEYIIQFLKAASELRTYQKIIEAFPHEKDLLDTLLYHGIIVPSWFKHSKRQNYSFKGPDLHNKRSMTLYLLISQSCNMGCVYCLNGRRTYQTDKNLTMDKEIAFKSIERCLKDISSKGRLDIIFSGGEPLLNWPLAKETMIYCEDVLRNKFPDKEIVYQFTTNLSLFPPDFIEWTKRFKVAFLCDVDGPEETHNACRPFKDGRPSHATIIRNIKRLIDAGLKVDLRATITSLNQDKLSVIMEHHKAIGGNASILIPVSSVNSDEDIFPERLLPSPQRITEGMIDIYRSNAWKKEKLYPFSQYAARIRPGSTTVLGCGLSCGNSAIVDVNGEVYPCIYLVGIRRFYLGNIMREDYPNRAVLHQLYNYLHVDRREDCKSCSWRYICGGGCPLWRLMVLHNPRATTNTIDYCKGINCEYIKKIIELLLWDKAQETASSLMKNLTGNETENMTDIIHCRQ